MKFLLVVACLAHSGLGSEWGYYPSNGPDTWADHYHDCGGSSQSPIDISSSGATWRDWCPLWFNFEWQGADSFTVTNNGHTVQLDFTDIDHYVSTCDWPWYRAGQFHFHWGSLASQGSEHTIDGQAAPLEMHIVTHSLNYADISAAADQPQGLAVLGFLFEITANDNPALAPIIASFANVKASGSSSSIDNFVMWDLISGALQGGTYYQYSGSLTTPGCYESVLWNVMSTKLGISQSQLNQFLTLEWDDESGNVAPISNNFRPTQLLNGREVKSAAADGNVI